MPIIRVHFDGKVLIPEEPVDLPVNSPLEANVTPVSKSADAGKPLAKLANALEKHSANESWPVDGAKAHDHYLYRLPKVE